MQLGLSPQELQVHGRTKGRQAQDPAHLTICSGRRSVMMSGIPVSHQGESPEVPAPLPKKGRRHFVYL